MIKHQINEAKNGHPGSSENKHITVLAVMQGVTKKKDWIGS